MKKKVAAFLCAWLLCGMLYAAEKNSVPYTGDRYRDPFGIGGSTEKTTDVRQEIRALALTLDGMVWDSQSPQAIISGKIVGINEEVSGAKVISIEAKGVKMKYKNQVFYLIPRGQPS